MSWDKLLESVIPPLPPETRWRLSVMGVVIIFGFHILWACGRIPGLDGFAQAQDLRAQKVAMEDIVKTQNTIVVRLIGADIEQARQQQCRALREQNVNAAEGWRTRLSASLSEYNSATGRDYPLRNCSEY